MTQQAHYYAFGMEIEGLTSASAPNKYRYNGKELNEDFGLNWNDYGARWYDAAVGRWWSVDPLAEQYKRWSGYVYGLNNPIKFVDPDGMQWADGELNAAANVLSVMGDVNVDQKFTFNTISGDVGETYMDNGVITMEINSDANAIHESTHGYQMYKGEIIGKGKGNTIYPGGGDKFVNVEIAAYRRQFAFDPSNVSNNVPSYAGKASRMNEINRIWLLGINDKTDFSGKFIYANGIMGREVNPAIIKSAIDEAKKGN